MVPLRARGLHVGEGVPAQTPILHIGGRRVPAQTPSLHIGESVPVQPPVIRHDGDMHIPVWRGRWHAVVSGVRSRIARVLQQKDI
jgi:hypothetical protein